MQHAKKFKKFCKCEQCPLSLDGAPNPRNIVFNRGSDQSWLAFVGEAPGYTERTAKKPFVGQSGKLIKMILDGLEINEKEVYFTNALLCHYPPSQKPNKASLSACGTRLREELKALPNLKVIIAVGGYAIESLIGESSVAKVIYNVYWNEELSAYIIPTYHPAFCFRQTEAFDDIVWAVERAKTLQDKSGPVQPYPVALEVARSPERALDVLQELSELPPGTRVAFDIESDGVDWMRNPIICIGFGIRTDEGYKTYIIPWVTGELDCPDYNYDFEPTIEMLFALKKLIDSPLKFVAHNAKFDVKAIAWQSHGNPTFKVAHDTMILHSCLDERGGSEEVEGVARGGVRVGSHALKVIARRYLGVPDWEGDNKKYLKSSKTPWSNIPRNVLYKYLGYDCAYTHALVDALYEVEKEDEPESLDGFPRPTERYENILMPALNEIIDMELKGVCLDVETAEARGKELEDEIVAYENEMLRMIRALEGRDGPPPLVLTKTGKVKKNQPEEFNPNSVVHKKKLLYDTLGVKLTPDLKVNLKGQARKTEWPTDKDLFIQLSDLHPICRVIAVHSTLKKEHGAFVKGMLSRVGSDGNIHGRFELSTTRTGRLSSRDPNLQNLKRGPIKRIFLPDEGDLFVNVDYAQLEVRVVASLSGDPGLIAACKGDIHMEITKQVFPSQLEAVQKLDSIKACVRWVESDNLLAPVGDAHNTKPYETVEEFRKAIVKHYRFVCKSVVFGLIYGRGAYSLAKGQLNCSPRTAQKFIDDFFLRFPKLKKWLDNQRDRVLKHQWLESPTGARRRFPFLTSEYIGRILNQTVNFSVQNYASDICLMAFVRLAPILKDRGYGRVLLLVHDAICFSIHPEFLDEALELIKDVMQNTTQVEGLVFEVDAEVGTNYGNVK